MGSLHNETWYLIKATDRYVLLVDCSYMSGWTNVGSIVWVRPEVVLTDDELAEIKSVYQKKLGWNFPEDFCVDRHGPDMCDGPSTVER
jgi:SUMO ligase MMS21 Smc5/6 complex component|tara:strand:- start:104 stop:367 length:264 start_codon:yes stop_codon:yes gene_type:complete